MTDQGEIYAQFVAGELEHERTRREMLDARASGTVTTSTAFVGLIAAVGLLGHDVLVGQPGPLQRTFLVAAVLTAMSALFAVWARWLHSYEVLDANQIRRLLTDDWRDTPVTARSKVAQFNAETLDTLRSGNNAKSVKLVISHVLQLVGLLMILTVALAATLRPVL
jgi:hypothetical protein